MKMKVEKTQTLLSLLEEHFPDSSRRTLRSWIKYGRLLRDGKPLPFATTEVSKGDEISLNQKQVTPPTLPFPIAYEDASLVIIEKPPGLLSVPLDKGGAPNALRILKLFYNQPIYPVHRLDREASGLLIFAKTTEAREGLDTLFRTHTMLREYVALVEGHLPNEEGTWESYLVEPVSYKVRSTSSSREGKKAVTHYQVEKHQGENTLLRLTLETGRKHQIRVHCKEMGHPILGDKRYGATENPYKRLCLHARRISFAHPITQETIDCTSLPRFAR